VKAPFPTFLPHGSPDLGPPAPSIQGKKQTITVTGYVIHTRNDDKNTFVFLSRTQPAAGATGVEGPRDAIQPAALDPAVQCRFAKNAPGLAGLDYGQRVTVKGVNVGNEVEVVLEDAEVVSGPSPRP
jgi:hypothetical protein